MNVLITGANGYLGGWVVYELMRDGHRIVCEDSHGRVVSLAPVLSPTAFEISDEPADVVIHLGWYARAGNGERTVQAECLRRTGELLSRVKGNPFIVFASSAAVYGNGGHHLFSECDLCLPTCAYGVNKLLAEDLIARGSYRSVVFRFGALMGKGLTRTKTDTCVNAFAIGGYRDKRVVVWNPESWKPVLHVRDAADLIRMAVRDMWKGTGHQLILNVAHESCKARYLAETVLSITGGEIVEDGDRGDVRSCRLDCTRLNEYLPDWWEFSRNVGDTIKEFKGYEMREGDKSRGW